MAPGNRWSKDDDTGSPDQVRELGHANIDSMCELVTTGLLTDGRCASTPGGIPARPYAEVSPDDESVDR